MQHLASISAKDVTLRETRKLPFGYVVEDVQPLSALYAMRQSEYTCACKCLQDYTPSGYTV